MYNAKFDRYCLNDIELLAHRRRRRRDAINTMELFVFRGSRARSPSSSSSSTTSSTLLLPAIAISPPPLPPRASLALFVPRQIRYRVIFQRDYINCPGDTGRASDHRRDRCNVVGPVIQPRTREVFLFSKVNAITFRCSLV